MPSDPVAAARTGNDLFLRCYDVVRPDMWCAAGPEFLAPLSSKETCVSSFEFRLQHLQQEDTGMRKEQFWNVISFNTKTQALIIHSYPLFR